MFYKTDYKNYYKSNVFSAKENDQSSKPKWLRLVTETSKEYCSQSSLHGFKYIGDSSLSLVERLYWAILISFSLYISVSIIWFLYNSGELQAIEMILHPHGVSIWDIPFPAVVVCSVMSVKKSYFDLETNVNNTKFRHYSKLICPNKDEFGEEFDDIVDEDFFEFLTEAAIPLNSLIINCIWEEKPVQCNKIFRPIITSLGQCYTFNNFPGQLVYKDYAPIPGSEDTHDKMDVYWDLETGYPKRDENSWMSVYPYWSEWSGDGSGLTITLKDNIEEYQPMCSRGYSGYEINIYPPDRTSFLNNPFRAKSNIHTYFSIHPQYTHAESDLLSVPMDIRDCIFGHEVQLEYFKTYSQTSCFLECYMKEMLRSCHCLPFDLHTIIGHLNYMYCNDAKYSCNARVVEQIVRQQNVPYAVNCSCMPLCSDILYYYQTSTENIVTEETLPPWAPGYHDTSMSNITRVSIFAYSNEINAYRRRRTTTFGDLLGGCGGLLSLLLGFSFISVFEVLYFIVIQPIEKCLRNIIKK